MEHILLVIIGENTNAKPVLVIVPGDNRHPLSITVSLCKDIIEISFS
jgi:hypothetical protein